MCSSHRCVFYISLNLSLPVQVLWELTAGALGKVPAVVTDTPSSSKDKHEEAVGGEEEEEDHDDLEDMKSRLEALRS